MGMQEALQASASEIKDLQSEVKTLECEVKSLQKLLRKERTLKRVDMSHFNEKEEELNRSNFKRVKAGDETDSWEATPLLSDTTLQGWCNMSPGLLAHFNRPRPSKASEDL